MKLIRTLWLIIIYILLNILTSIVSYFKIHEIMYMFKCYKEFSLNEFIDWQQLDTATYSHSVGQSNISKKCYKMFEPKKGQAFYVCLKTLQLTYCLPYKDDNKWVSYIKFTLIMLIYSSAFIEVLMHLVITFKNKTGVNISEDVAVIVNLSSFILACLLFRLHHRKWLSICSNIVDFTEFGKPLNFEETQKRGEVYAIAMIGYTIMGIIAYFLTALLEISTCEKQNEKRVHHEVCGTLAPIWLPNGTSTLPILIIINIIQLLSAFGTFVSMICVILMIHNSTTLLLCRVDHFEDLFHSIFEENDSRMQFRKLRKCIIYQESILRMGSNLGYLAMLNEGHAVISSAVCIGCIGNQILMEKSIRSFMLLMGYITGLFMICHAGQKMIDKTEYMQEIVYFSKWYTCDLKILKDINFILARCKYPVYLRLPFGYINFSLFLMVVKTSYSYVTVLNQTT